MRPSPNSNPLAIAKIAAQATAAGADPNRGFWSELGTATVRGTAGLVTAAGGLATMAGADDLGKTLTDAGQFGEAVAEPSNPNGSFLRSAANITGEALPQISGATGAGILTGGLGAIPALGAFAATSAAPVVGQKYVESYDAQIARGVPPEEARKTAVTEALVDGGITLATSLVPGFAILTKNPLGREIARNAVVGAISKYGVAALAEGSQEVVEAIGQEVAKDLIRQDPEAFDPEFWSQLPAQFIAGAVLGGAARGVASVADGSSPQGDLAANPQAQQVSPPTAQGAGGQSLQVGTAPLSQAVAPQAPASANPQTSGSVALPASPEFSDSPPRIAARSSPPVQSIPSPNLTQESVNEEGEQPFEERYKPEYVDRQTKWASNMLQHAQMSREDLEATVQQMKDRDFRIAAEFLGLDPNKPRKLKQSEIDRIDDAGQVEPEVWKAVFGDQQSGEPSVEDLEPLLDAMNNVEHGDPETLAKELSYAIKAIGRTSDPRDMSAEQIAAAAQIHRSGQWAKEQGFDVEAIQRSAVRQAASAFADPEDAAFVLERFLKKPSKPETAKASELPTPARKMLPGKQDSPTPILTQTSEKSASEKPPTHAESGKLEQSAAKARIDEQRTTQNADSGLTTEKVLTSARKEEMAENRKSLGLDTLNSPDRRSWEQALETAHDQGIPDKAMRLAEEVAASSRALSDIETAGVVVRAANLKNEHASLSKKLESSKDPGEIAEVSAEINRIEDEFDLLSRALRISGTEKGRALASQKLTIDQDYRLVSVLTRAKAAKAAELTPAERGRFEGLSKQLDEATGRIEALEKQLNEALANRAIRESRAKKYNRMSSQAKDAELNALLGKAKALIDNGCLN